MKRSLYGRLKERSKDYSFYIPPLENNIGLLFKAISSDLLDTDQKLIFLQNLEGTVTFGVRETLTLQDAFGRPVCNFMGYQLEPGESPETIPFFNAFSSQFGAISEEAYECHRLLNENSERGKNMQDTQIVFENGYPQKGNRWDDAVMQIANNPSRNVLMMFDETGNRLKLGFGYEQTRKPAPERTVKRAPPARSYKKAGQYDKIERPLSKHGPAPVSEEYRKSTRGLGITSSVTLNPYEKISVPPLDDYVPPHRSGLEKLVSSAAIGCKKVIKKFQIAFGLRNDDDFSSSPRNDR